MGAIGSVEHALMLLPDDLGLAEMDLGRGVQAACPSGGARSCSRRRITVSKRMRAKLKALNAEVRCRRHERIPVHGRWLSSVVRGHVAYHAVPGNSQAVQAFRGQVTRH